MELQLPTTASQLARFLGVPLIGDGEAPVSGLGPLEQAKTGILSFCSHRKLLSLLPRLTGGVLLAPEEWIQKDLPLTYLVVKNPQAAFAKVALEIHRREPKKGISPRAEVDPSAVIAADAYVGPFAVVSAGVTVGAGSIVESFAFLGENVRVGEQSLIGSHVSLLERVCIGNRVRIFAGTVIGSDGFGLIPNSVGGFTEMPQLGTVVIEDDVRIGAKCTIDRATLGVTRIGRGTKIDDQVHIAHNVEVGQNCILCGQVGLAGSVVIEDGAILAGQVGVNDHVRIGKGARIGAQSGVAKDLEGPGDYFMTPAMPMAEGLKVAATMRRLPDLAKRLKGIEDSLKKGEGPSE